MSTIVSASHHPQVNHVTTLESKASANKFTAHASTAVATAAARAPGNPEVYSKYSNAFCPTSITTSPHPITQSDLCSMAFTIQNNGSDTCPGTFFMSATRVPGNNPQNIKICGQSKNPNEPCLPPGQDLKIIACDPNVVNNVNVGGLRGGSVQIEPAYIAVPSSIVDHLGERSMGCYASQPIHPTDPSHRVAYTKTTASIAQSQMSPSRIITG
jgi:hypothetical protein